MAMPPTGSNAHEQPARTWTTRKLLDWIANRLEEAGVDAPRVCAELLVSAAIGCDRLRLYMEPERVAGEDERERLRDWVRRASSHEPVQYLVGETTFNGRAFEVDRSTLIPRPSTLALVEHMESVTGRTVVTANQASLWQGLRMVRAAQTPTGAGSLFELTSPRTFNA